MRQETDQIFQFVSPHFVVIVWIDAPKDNPHDEHTECFSGSLVSVAGRIFILTAGHVVGLLNSYANSDRELHLCSFYGNWNDPAVNAGKININYETLEHWHLDQFDEGLDFGLIALNEYIAKHLYACKMRPVYEENWLDPPEQLRNHILLGTPIESVRSQTPSEPDGSGGKSTFSCAMLYVTPVLNPPPGMIRQHARFYGRVRAPEEVEPGTTVADVNGMSGGPVYAAGYKADGTPGYWLIGVQSGWHKPTRTIAACPVKEILKLFRQKFDDLDKKLGRRQFE